MKQENNILIIMKISSIICVLFFTGIICWSQSYNQSKAELEGFLQRMYSNVPFEGVKVFTDYENTYLLSVVTLASNNYESSSAMNRVASVKAASQASKFFNGSQITSECIIRTVNKPDRSMETTIEEVINENSIGYVNMLELITSFESDNRYVFIYGKKIDTPNAKKKKGKR